MQVNIKSERRRDLPAKPFDFKPCILYMENSKEACAFLCKILRFEDFLALEEK